MKEKNQKFFQISPEENNGPGGKRTVLSEENKVKNIEKMAFRILG